MCKITIKKTENEKWNTVADLLNGEVGTVKGYEICDGIKTYKANFYTYGALFVDIPEEVCDVQE